MNIITMMGSICMALAVLTPLAYFKFGAIGFLFLYPEVVFLATYLHYMVRKLKEDSQ